MELSDFSISGIYIFINLSTIHRDTNLIVTLRQFFPERITNQLINLSLCFLLVRPVIKFSNFPLSELQQITDALVDQSSKELYNITKSAGFMIDMGGSKGKVFTPLADVYNSFLDDAITGMVNGAYDYNTLVKRMVSRMTGSGLRTDHAFKTENGGDWGIDYASGWHNRIDVAARRALLTGFNQLAGTVTDMNAQRLGTNLFEVSWHPGARPSHTVWQGRIYTKEELASKCGLGTGPGLCGWSCHHNYYSFVPGVSQRNWSDAWLKEMNARENTPVKFRGREYTTYQATQKQRQMETALRARREQVQLLRHAEADPHDITTARCKYQTQLDEYKRFSRAMKLPEQMERIYTGRTGGRIAPSPQTYAKWQAEQINNAKERQEKKRREDMEAADHKKWLKDIGAASTTLDTLDKYTEARHYNTEEYQLLRGYGQAVKKGDINPLVGFDEYQRVAADVRARVVGTTTSDGVQIDSYTTHFIDRVIGQTADPHEGMREGVTVERVLEALQAENTTTRVMADGDMRRTYRSDSASVTVSIRDHRIIQTNPRNEDQNEN
ncbi:hypothetical protein B6K86_08470 [Lachnospiraceae bacterium]|nr:hypothetical protein B6K86_08470 [Lachnospiraceae bacterium]